MNNTPRFDAKKIQDTFSAAATQYDRYAQLQQEILNDSLELARNYWKSESTILDLGAGTGMLTQRANEEKLGWDIYGLDLSLSMCRVAHQHGMQGVNAHAESLPFADNSFDGVFSSLMLQWADNERRVFEEIFRVLKPGGTCVLATFTYGTLEELREAFRALDAATHVNEFGPSNYFSAIAVHAGLRVLSGDEDIITEYYPDMTSLMRSLKSIGASTKQRGARKGLMTPGQLRAVERAYTAQYEHADGLPASWHVLTLLLEKP